MPHLGLVFALQSSHIRLPMTTALPPAATRTFAQPMHHTATSADGGPSLEGYRLQSWHTRRPFLSSPALRSSGSFAQAPHQRAPRSDGSPSSATFRLQTSHFGSLSFRIACAPACSRAQPAHHRFRLSGGRP
jgi:hypothetical protein